MTRKVIDTSVFISFYTQSERETSSVLINCYYLEDDESTKEEERSYGSMMMERLTGSPDGRVDHVLQVIKLLPFSTLCIGVLLLTLVIKMHVLHYARKWYCAVALA